MEEEKNKIWLFIRVGITLLLAILGRFVFTEPEYVWYVPFLVNLIAYFLISYDIILEVFEGFKNKEIFTEEFLMVIASTGAFCLRFFGPDSSEYFEAIIVILLFQVGEYFQDLAEDKTKDAITEAIDLRKEEITIETKEGNILIIPEQVQPGNICVFGNGNKILCDGIIVDGCCDVDESSISGESMPISKTKGHLVYSGTVILSGSIKVRCTAKYEDSTVGKLISLIKDNSEKKSKYAGFAEKFAAIYTPIVIFLGFLIGIILPLIFDYSNPEVWRKYTYIGLNIFVIGCPCAIVISIPLTCFSALGLASKKGIMVKGAKYFDLIREAKIYCFDKTGTITSSEIIVKEIHEENITEEEFIEYATAAESRSSHPIAKSLLKYSNLSIQNNDIISYKEHTSLGIEIVYKGHKILFGKHDLLSSKIEPVSSYLSSYLEVDGKYCGYIEFEEQIKPTSKTAISSLINKGYKTLILSGDNERNCNRVSNELKCDYRASLTPLEKSVEIERLQSINKTVFVGDGINDAPSIVKADVGIAMGSKGSDLAIENADIILLKDDLSQILQLQEISKITFRRNIFNISITLISKIVIGILSFIIPSFPLWIAVFADTGLTLLLVLYALTLLRKKL